MHIMNAQTCRNHYKAHPDWKNKIIFFIVGGFYRTYESDATLISRLFGFQVQVQGGMRMTGFPATSSEKYFDLLRQEDYSYVLLQLADEKIQLIDSYEGSASLEITVPIEVYSGLLEEMKSLLTRYEAVVRVVKQVDVSMVDFNPHNEAPDYSFPEFSELKTLTSPRQSPS
ncbi:MAG: hypothetical protein LBD75_05400 [Candidatus Peribacteria bacterium]|jgi:DNA mismatch repair ATPase MutS|nr:hypothetical protein [Candidatus Peribacteria bacterium]